MAPALWHCQSCGFSSPWWYTADAFPFCTTCEKQRRYEAAEARRLANATYSEPASVTPPARLSAPTPGPYCTPIASRASVPIREYVYVDKQTGKVTWQTRRRS